jgi:hypothetical protein
MLVDFQGCAPNPLLSVKRPITLVQEAVWAPGSAWMGVEMSPSSGFNPRTVQPIANRYTDWVIPAHHFQSQRRWLRILNTCENNLCVCVCVCVCFRIMVFLQCSFAVLSRQTSDIGERLWNPFSLYFQSQLVPIRSWDTPCSWWYIN